MTYTLQEKIAELRREIRLRQYVYRNRVDWGKMTIEDARRQINILREIIEDYEKRQAAEEPELALTGGSGPYPPATD
jgi:hypothetical protein